MLGGNIDDADGDGGGRESAMHEGGVHLGHARVLREVAAVRVEADCCAGGGEAVPSLTERDPEGEVGALSS